MLFLFLGSESYMMQPYRSSEWKRFRDDVIQLDNWVCARCSRGSADGVILQVHHKVYFANRKPWDYPYELCEALCKGCHAEEHGKIRPRYGWEFVGHEDLGELIGTCEYCGTTIRHVFLIQHENWVALEVGEICCDHLTNTHVASDHIDSVRRFNERRKRFVSSSRWTADSSGKMIIKQKSITAAIVPQGSTYRLQMNGRQGRLEFKSLLDAKMKAFDLIESGAISAYLARVKSPANPNGRR